MTAPDAPRVGLHEAAAMTGLSLSTLRRRREALRAHGATQKDDGSWSIPVPALVDLGMLDRVTTAAPAPQDATPDEVADLRVEVERERGLRLAAEREAEAIRAHLATAQSTIRMIEAAPPRIETRVERVEVPTVEHVEVPVPTTPRWVWPVCVGAVVLVLLAAALTAWSLLHPPAPPASAPAPAVSSSAPAIATPESAVEIPTLPSSPASSVG